MINYLRSLRNSLRKKTNSGSSLVTAIIVVAFMSILGTIALYVAGQNFKMKVIDSNNKRSFYKAEEVVETLKSQLVIDVAAAAQRATKAAGAIYVEQDSVAIREYKYLERFGLEFESIWNKHFDNASDLDGTDPIDETQAITQLFSSGTVTNVVPNGNKWSFYIVINGEKLFCEINDASSTGNLFKYKDSLKKPASLFKTSNVDNTKRVPAPYLIEDFNITVTDSKGVVSVIRTTFQITPPELNWDNTQGLLGEDITAGNITEADYTDSVLYLNWSKE